MDSYIFANTALFVIIASSLIFILIKPFYFGNLIKILDKPEDNSLKIHKKSTPKNGGFIIILFLLLYLILNQFYNFDYFNPSIFIFVLSFFIVGLIDDYLNIKPIIRILLFALSTYFFLILNNDFIIELFYIENINNFFSLNYFAMFFTIFCFIFLQNSLNMLDGINGSLLSYSILITAVISIMNPEIFSFVFLFALIIVFIQNINNKIFLGNNGSSVISFIISFLLIRAHSYNPKDFSSEVIILLCFLPAVDMTRLFVERIYKRKNPFFGDLNHFHHIVFLKRKKSEWIFYLVITYIFLTYVGVNLNVNLALLLSLFTYSFFIWKFR